MQDLHRSRGALRVGTVPYLNALPLIANLTRFLPEASLVTEVPAILESALVSERVDVALLSSICLLAHSDLDVMPGAAIGCDGRVDSVLLYRRTPLENVRKVCLDPDSLTSNTLLRVLLERERGLSPAYTLSRAPIDEAIQTHDAVLRIGYLQAECSRRVEIDDLGVLWKQATGLPFVFALWLLRPGVCLDAKTEAAFSEAKTYNLDHIDSILDDEPSVQRWGRDACRRYLRERVIYEYGSRQREALELFLEHAEKLRPL